jgi:hypothetical protein
MICRSLLYFAPNLNVCDVAKVPSQKKVTFFNGRCRNMHSIWASLRGDCARNDEQLGYF